MVFDDFTYGTSANPAYTVSSLDEFLGKYDQLAVHVLVDQVDQPLGDFAIDAEHSGDGQRWKLAAHLASGTVFDSDVNLFAGAMANAMAFVRLLLYFRGS